MALYRNFNDVSIYDKLDIDIIRYILSLHYKRVHAANVIQKYVKLFITNKVENIYRCFISGDITFIHQEYKFNILNYKNILRTTNACKCCTRHQLNKPHTMQKWIETPVNQKNYASMDFVSRKCECSCRHLMRNICR
jgi:hypothetical protein